MQKKTISILLCLALLVTMFAFAVPTNAATADSQSTGVSKIDSADDFSWDNVNMYFLLTDRFYNGDTSNDHSYGRAVDANGNALQGWDTAPGTFHGGDFKGLTQKINEGYFNDLGVNAIWISAPYEQIHGYVGSGESSGNFAHYSYHGYYVLDYTEPDLNFGTKADFKAMVDAAHSRGLRVVLDVVMNHAGYNNLLDMEQYHYGTLKSGYQNEKYRLTDAGKYHSFIDYTSNDWGKWWGSGWIRCGLPGYTDGGSDDLTQCLNGLPDFKTESTAQVSIPTFLQDKWNQENTLSAKLAKYGSTGTVSDYITTWLAEWVETYGVDGFRCDTAKHVEKASWNKLKTKCVAALKKWRQNNPTAVGADWDEDFWMTGECWGYSKNWGYDSYFTEGGFDSMINFDITGNVSANPSGMTGPENIEGLYASYASAINTNPNYNLLTYISSHDTGLARQNPYWQGTALQLLPGGVQIFYGDETSRPLVSGVPVDGAGHAVRSNMNFGSNPDQLAHWQKVGKFRSNHVAVGAGSHQQITAYNSSTGYTFSRTYSDENVTDSVVCCIGAPANQSIAVNVSSVFSDGKTVTNEYDGSTAVVTNGKATFNSGAQGVILISGPQSTISLSLTGEYGFYDSETVTVGLRGADYAMASVAGGTPFRVTNGQTFEIGQNIAVGTEFTVTLTASNATETVSKTFNFKKKDPNDVTTIYYDNSSTNWNPVKAYVYYESGSTVVENAKWGGEAMTYDSSIGLYKYEVPDNLRANGLVIFNNGASDQYPAGQNVRGLEINGTDMVLRADKTWEPYSPGPTVPSSEPTVPSSEPTVPPVILHDVLLGDANQDGSITVKDVTAIQRHCAQFTDELLTGDKLIAADTNQDENVNIKDATMIQIYLIDRIISGNHTGETVTVGETPTTPTTPTTQPTTQPPTNTTEPTVTTQPQTGIRLNASALAQSDAGNPADYWIWTWNNDNDGQWVKGTGSASSISFATVKSKCLFVRYKKGETADWSREKDGSVFWGKTANQDVQTGGTFVISGYATNSNSILGSWQ